MSVATQVAIAPSRALATIEAILLVGAIVLPGATWAAHAAPASPLPAIVGALGAGGICAALLFRHRLRAEPRHISFHDGAAATWIYRGRQRHGVIGEGTLAWPGLVVVSLSDGGGRLGGARPAWPVLRAESSVESARRLHRHVLWLSRSSAHGTGSSTPSVG